MKKDILGGWGSTLSDGDYSRALAALGVLESSGTKQHPAASNPATIAAALQEEFRLGKQTPTWRNALGVDSKTRRAFLDRAAREHRDRRYRARSVRPADPRGGHVAAGSGSRAHRCELRRLPRRDPSVPSLPDDLYGPLRKDLEAAGLSVSGRIDGPDLSDWFAEVVREASDDVPIHAAVRRAGRAGGRDPLIHADPYAVDGCRLSRAERQG